MSYGLSGIPVGNVLSVLILVLITGCGSEPPAGSIPQGKASARQPQTAVPKGQREFVLVVPKQGSPVLSVECKYLGKSPADAEVFRAKFKHDWSRHDTDFYKVTLKNTSPRTVNLLSVQHRVDVGPYRGKSHFDSRSIAATWGRSEIAAGQSITRDTHFVWAVKDRNVLHKLYQCETQDGQGQTVKFEFDLPLQYER